MTTKQQACSAQSSSPTTQNYNRQVPSFLGSPRFKAFTKAVADTDVAAVAAVISPTSILDTKQFSPFCNNNPKSPELFSENKHKGIGLALIDDKAIEENSSSSVLFGTKLRVQIPPLPTQSPKSPSGSANSGTQTKANNCTHCLSVTEMEPSEKYARVISHGPNPKTTRIFDNCTIESYYSLSDIKSINYPAPENFLSFCCTCKKNLEPKNDIYIYRGERAFCSEECRYQEMLLDDEVEK